jgi:Helicase HerA, central domain
VDVRFTFAAAQRDDGYFDLAVGTLLGIRSPHSLIVGVLYKLKINAAGSAVPATGLTGTIDLIGEIFLDNPAPRFRRGVLNHPRSVSRRANSQPCSAITARAELISADCTRTARSRSRQTSMLKHFGVIGSTGAGQSSSVVLLLHEIAASKDLRVC